jgi:hypothetical protein
MDAKLECMTMFYYLRWKQSNFNHSEEFAEVLPPRRQQGWSDAMKGRSQYYCRKGRKDPTPCVSGNCCCTMHTKKGPQSLTHLVTMRAGAAVRVAEGEGEAGSQCMRVDEGAYQHHI